MPLCLSSNEGAKILGAEQGHCRIAGPHLGKLISYTITKQNKNNNTSIEKGKRNKNVFLNCRYTVQNQKPLISMTTRLLGLLITMETPPSVVRPTRKEIFPRGPLSATMPTPVQMGPVLPRDVM